MVELVNQLCLIEAKAGRATRWSWRVDKQPTISRHVEQRGGEPYAPWINFRGSRLRVVAGCLFFNQDWYSSVKLLGQFRITLAPEDRASSSVWIHERELGRR